MLAGGWQPQGPELSIGFSRVSRDGRITLVIDELCGAKVRTLLALSAFENVADAVANLAERVGTPQGNIGKVVLAERVIANLAGTNQIREWAEIAGVDAVIWTALIPNLAEKTGQLFTVEGALNYLGILSPGKRAKALDYIRNAPKALQTPVRAAVDASCPMATK